MGISDIGRVETTEFQQVQGIISLHRSRALQTVNNENLLAAWEVGAFVSDRLKNSVWGSKTVVQFSEYLRTQDPDLKEYSRVNIYKSAMPRQKLNFSEMLRCFKNKTFASLLGDKHNQSKGLINIYPQALPMLKDTIFVDFFGLPQKHSEKRLQNSILDNMKDFVLELGKDFLFYDKEYPLQVGNSTFKVDLLFYHRGLQCLVAIELETGKFKPEYMGQLEFYLEALDRDVRRSNKNPSIGILLCQEADHSVVEYAMSCGLSSTMIAEYERQLIPKEVLQHSLEEFIQFLNPKNKK